jgi:hypothetical protein
MWCDGEVFLFAAVLHLMPQAKEPWWTRVPDGLLLSIRPYLRNADFNDLMSFWR